MQLQNCKKNDKGNKRLRRPGTIRRHPDRTQRFLRPRQNTAKTLRKKEIPLLYPLPTIRKIHSQMLPPGPGQTLAECRRSRKISCKDQLETILPEIRPGSGLCRTPHPLAVIHGAEQQPVLPEFQNALAAVTARFYSMEYQSSDKKYQRTFLPGYGTQITADAQTLQKK